MRVGVGRVDVHVGVIEVADFMQQPMSHGFSNEVSIAHRRIPVDDDGEVGDESVA